MNIKNKIKITVNGKQMQIIPELTLKSLITKLKMPLNKIAIELNKKIIDKNRISKIRLKKGDKILEIGSGSGYQTAILVLMKAQVYSIERIYELYKKSKRILSILNLMPRKIIWEDGYLGLKKDAPFDKILIAAACAEIPMNLVKQLKVGGKMIIPIGNQKNQIMNLITRISKNKIKKIEMGNFLFVPMLTNKI